MSLDKNQENVNRKTIRTFSQGITNNNCSMTSVLIEVFSHDALVVQGQRPPGM